VGRRLTLGEPDGSASERVQAIAAALARAGLKAPVTDDIRGEIWLLSAPGVTPLSYGALRALGDRTVEAPRQRGIGSGNRVALMRKTGPEMEAAFLAAAGPLNPA